jgi:hypothetical protein
MFTVVSEPCHGDISMKAARETTTQWFAKSQHVEARGAESGVEPFVYWNPCLGIPAITIESPRRYFGIQLMVGIACLLVLLMFG